MSDAPRDGVHVLLLVGGQAIEGWWDASWPQWQVVSLPSHGCGCCCSDNDPPTGWAPLPVEA